MEASQYTTWFTQFALFTNTKVQRLSLPKILDDAVNVSHVTLSRGIYILLFLLIQFVKKRIELFAVAYLEAVLKFRCPLYAGILFTIFPFKLLEYFRQYLEDF